VANGAPCSADSLRLCGRRLCSGFFWSMERVAVTATATDLCQEDPAQDDPGKESQIPTKKIRLGISSPPSLPDLPLDDDNSDEVETRPRMSSLERAATVKTVVNADMIPHVQKAKAAKINVKLGRGTRWAALRSLVGLSVFSIGRTSILADLKAELVSLNTSIGLISALILTMVYPIMYDAVPAEQTNGYLKTSPAAVGCLYFFTISLSTVFFTFATLCTVAVNMFLDLTNSEAEARFFIRVSHTQIRKITVEYLVAGLVTFLGSAVLWMVITLLALQDEGGDDAASGEQVGDESANSKKWTASLILSMCIFGGILVYTGQNLSEIVAKLYKSHFQFLDDGSEATDASDYIIDVRSDVLWGLLLEYQKVDGPGVTLNGFKEYIARRVNQHAVSLSAHCDRLAERLFEDHIEQEVTRDYETIRTSRENRNRVIDLRAKELWELLSKYCVSAGSSVSLEGFKAFITSTSNQPEASLSLVCANMAERLFNKRIEHEVARDYETVKAKVEDFEDEDLRG